MMEGTSSDQMLGDQLHAGSIKAPAEPQVSLCVSSVEELVFWHRTEEETFVLECAKCKDNGDQGKGAAVFLDWKPCVVMVWRLQLRGQNDPKGQEGFVGNAIDFSHHDNLNSVQVIHGTSLA